LKLYNTKNKKELVSFQEALFKGIGSEGGLYMPVEIPLLQKSFFENIEQKTFLEICFEISNLLLKDEIPELSLQKIISSAINYDAPLVHLSDKIKVLELFHGPTLAFKDFGARFMAESFAHFIQSQNRETTILVATSGDTGSAVANAFYKKPGIKVILLYPAGKISKIQEMQFATLGNNISALEISGTFDDCQSLVKNSFSDEEIVCRINLSSANSINIARLIPQTFYYFRAYQQLANKSEPFIFCVPSGNLGNLTAGLISQKMGLPVHKFISAVNNNSVFSDYISTGNFIPRLSVSTLSNAMDVGNPNNFERIAQIFQNSYEEIKDNIESISISDKETVEAIKKAYNEFGYLVDPHGAVGFSAMHKISQLEGITKILLETAHPAKFGNVIKFAIGKDPELPESLKSSLRGNKQTVKLSGNFRELKEFLLKN
jgi:threonine synthase